MGATVEWTKVGAASRALWERVADAVLQSQYETTQPLDEETHG